MEAVVEATELTLSMVTQLRHWYGLYFCISIHWHHHRETNVTDSVELSVLELRNRYFLDFAANLIHGNIVGPITNRILVPSTWHHASVILGLQLGSAIVSDGSTRSPQRL